jgi:hypothetical protein
MRCLAEPGRLVGASATNRNDVAGGLPVVSEARRRDAAEPAADQSLGLKNRRRERRARPQADHNVWYQPRRPRLRQRRRLPC